MDDPEVKRTIQNILHQLKKDDKYNWFFVGGGFLAGLASIPVLEYFNLEKTPYVMIGVAFLFSGLIAAVIVSDSSQKRAVKAYQEAFQEDSSERGVADRIVAALDEPKTAVESLCEGLGLLRGEKARKVELAKAEELRQLAETERSRNHISHTQETFPITGQFECGSCNRNVDWMKGARNYVCHYCKVTLMLPSRMICPSCGGAKIRIMSKPQHTVSLAGLLMYGPAGLLAGKVIDSVVGDLKQDMQEKIKDPVFCCETCKKYWGVKLPVAMRANERMISLSENENQFVIELEKLGELKKQGLLTEEEFVTAKRKIIN
ncbi:MAG: hypothetical protein NTZ74_05705 [Chloroflexi bacterium]|nr:hypothetical protein [Chloroflexota bacterium]